MDNDWSAVLFGARLADMGDVDYRNTLAIASLIELLMDKGVITQEEIGRKSAALDTEAERLCRVPRLPHRRARGVPNG